MYTTSLKAFDESQKCKEGGPQFGRVKVVVTKLKKQLS
jgi:hypothetical protein